MSEQTKKIDSPQAGSTKWVDKMREHFARTGFYDVEHLHRLLGDPRSHSGLQPSMEPPFNFSVQKQE